MRRYGTDWLGAAGTCDETPETVGEPNVLTAA
jgi:hypothetical protein